MNSESTVSISVTCSGLIKTVTSSLSLYFQTPGGKSLRWSLRFSMKQSYKDRAKLTYLSALKFQGQIQQNLDLKIKTNITMRAASYPAPPDITPWETLHTTASSAQHSGQEEHLSFCEKIKKGRKGKTFFKNVYVTEDKGCEDIPDEKRLQRHDRYSTWCQSGSWWEGGESYQTLTRSADKHCGWTTDRCVSVTFSAAYDCPGATSKLPDS